jgi:CrcB protein
MSPRPDPRALAAVFAGGGLGGVARIVASQQLTHGTAAWPWATYGVNLVGAFLLGYVVTRLQERLPVSAYRRPFLGTGICGGLTTFSSMQIELLDMLDAHRWLLAGGYAAASVAGGLLAVMAATALVRRVRVVV